MKYLYRLSVILIVFFALSCNKSDNKNSFDNSIEYINLNYDSLLVDSVIVINSDFKVAQLIDWVVDENASEDKPDMLFLQNINNQGMMTMKVSNNGDFSTYLQEILKTFEGHDIASESIYTYSNKTYHQYIIRSAGFIVLKALIEIDENKYVDINFLIDENVGGIFQSFAIANPALNNEAQITSFSFKDIDETSINISENKIDIIVPSTTNISNLITEFTLSNGAKAFISKVFQESGISEQDYTSPVIINVLSQDESVLKEYLINVDKETVTEALTVNLTSSTNALINTNSAEIELITNEDIDVVNATNFELKNAVIQSIVKVDETTYNIKLIPFCYNR